MSGGRYVSPALAEHVISDLIAETERPRHESLSKREYQILCMIGTGETVAEIATGLKLSVDTVATYRGRMVKKMAMKGTAELRHYAVSHRLVAAPRKHE